MENYGVPSQPLECNLYADSISMENYGVPSQPLECNLYAD